MCTSCSDADADAAESDARRSMGMVAHTSRAGADSDSELRFFGGRRPRFFEFGFDRPPLRGFSVAAWRPMLFEEELLFS